MRAHTIKRPTDNPFRETDTEDTTTGFVSWVLRQEGASGYGAMVADVLAPLLRAGKLKRPPRTVRDLTRCFLVHEVRLSRWRIILPLAERDWRRWLEGVTQ